MGVDTRMYGPSLKQTSERTMNLLIEYRDLLAAAQISFWTANHEMSQPDFGLTAHQLDSAAEDFQSAQATLDRFRQAEDSAMVGITYQLDNLMEAVQAIRRAQAAVINSTAARVQPCRPAEFRWAVKAVLAVEGWQVRFEEAIEYALA